MPDHPNLIFNEIAAPCFVCGEPTHFVHLDFETWMHPTCEHTAWAMYEEALRA